jgi:hypothetical protein
VRGEDLDDRSSTFEVDRLLFGRCARVVLCEEVVVIYVYLDIRMDGFCKRRMG